MPLPSFPTPPGWGLPEPVQYQFPDFPHYETRKNEALFREYLKVGLEERKRDRKYGTNHGIFRQLKTVKTVTDCQGSNRLPRQ